MKHIVLLILLVVNCNAEEQLMAYYVTGEVSTWAHGKPLLSIKYTDQNEAIKKQIDAVYDAIEGKSWDDFGPDSKFVSIKIIKGNTEKEVRTWYPVFCDSDRVAVDEKLGIVSIASLEEKRKIEEKYSDKYRALVGLIRNLKISIK